MRIRMCWRQAWKLEVLEKNELKISGVILTFLEIRFENKVEENGIDYNIRFEGQLLDKWETLKFLGWFIQENGTIIKNVTCKIGWGKKQQVCSIKDDRKVV